MTRLMLGRTALPTFRPFSRSRKAREDRAQSVRNRMAAYREHVGHQAKAERAADLDMARHHRAQALRELLWARAEVEQALWLETSGRMGTEHATPGTTIQSLPIRGASVTIDND